MMWSSSAKTLSTGSVIAARSTRRPVELQFVLHQLVLLIEILQPLLGSLAGMVRPVGDPFLHAQQVQQLRLVVDDVEQVEIVFHQRAHRRHLGEHRTHELARQAAVGIDQPVDVLGSEAAGPDIEEAVMGVQFFTIGVEIDRRDRQDELVDLVRVQRGVAGREDAALADAEQRDLVVSGFTADPLYRGMDVVIDIVVDRQPSFGTRGLAPINQPQIESLRQQAADQRSIRLKIGHRVTAN